MEENKIPALIIHWMLNKATANELIKINTHLMHKMAELKLNDGIRTGPEYIDGVPVIKDPRIIQNIKDNKFVTAAKLYKDSTKSDLIDAKRVIDTVVKYQRYYDSIYMIKGL